jgi:cytochrome P450
VRIGPNELHVKDSDYYFDLYNMGNRLDKYDWYYGMLGKNTALFPTIHADVHKLRRNAVAPFFSTQAVARFHPKVQEVTDRFTERMQESIERDEPIPMAFAFRCLSTDIICEYLFGKQLNLVESDDWGRYFYSSWRSLWEMSPLIRQFPFMLDLFKMVPKSILAKVQPKAYKVLDMERQTDDWTRDLLAANPEDIKNQRFSTVLWEVAHTDALPQHEKSFDVLATGGNNLLATGFETTGMALSHLMYGVLANPNIHKRLYKELEAAIPDPSSIPSHQVLEKLPYLNVVVKEGIR